MKPEYYLWLSTPKFTARTELIIFNDEFGEPDFNGATIVNPAPILRKFNGDNIKQLLLWVNKKWPGEVKSQILKYDPETSKIDVSLRNASDVTKE